MEHPVGWAAGGGTLALAVSLVAMAVSACGEERAAGTVLKKGLPPGAISKGELPDPLLREDGRRVASAADWRRRRDEIEAILLRNEYGHVPPRPARPIIVTEGPVAWRNGRASKYRRLALKMGPRHQLTIQVDFFLPADRPPPYRALVRIGLGCPAVGEVNRRGYLLAAFDVLPFPDFRPTRLGQTP